jgi:hypothetical protein
MKTGAPQRVVTVRKLSMSDPEAQFDQPVPGTMAERLDLMWELALTGISLGGGDDQQRLQRHVARFVGRER